MQAVPSGAVLRLVGDLGTVSGGSGIAQWNDQSGFGNNALQADAARQPVVVAGALNGHDVLRFDGADDGLGLTGTSIMTKITTCIVVRLLGGASGFSYYPVALGSGNNVTGEYTGIETRNSYSGASEEIMDVFGGFGNDARAVSRSVSTFDAWRIIVMTTDTNIGNTTVHVNGRPATMSLTGSNVAMNVQLGNSTGTGFGAIGGAWVTGAFPGFAKCDVAEVLVYDRVLTSGERSDLEDYLAQKYGIPLFGCRTSFVEDFSGGSLGPRFDNIGQCGAPLVSGGKLVLHRPSGCALGVVAQFDRASHEICGDFALSVDYSLTSWPPLAGQDRFVGIVLSRAAEPDLGTALQGGIERFSTPATGGCAPYLESYKLYGTDGSGCVATWVQTAHTSGRFRFVRLGTTMYQEIWNGSDWVVARTGAITSDPVVFHLYASSPEGTTDFEAQMDDVTLATNPPDPLGVPAMHNDARLSLVAGPNPARQETALRFTLSEAEHARVAVFDLSGRCVRTLLDETCTAGLHEVDWDGRVAAGRLADTGLYFVRLETAQGSRLVKLVVER